jgi:hypothetical protein
MVSHPFARKKAKGWGTVSLYELLRSGGGLRCQRLQIADELVD